MVVAATTIASTIERPTLIIDRWDRTILQALYPVSDPVGAIEDSLRVLAAAA